jgi:hypothetical protein
MPVLDVSGCYGRPFDAYARLLPVMHAPRDSNQRERWERVARRLQLAETDEDRLTCTEAWDHLMGDMRRAVTRRDGLHKASFAATVLIETLRTEGTVEKVMSDLESEMCTAKWTGHSHATLELYWKEFRSVAHVWAAFTVLGMSPGFKPPGLGDVMDMFSVAESLRRRGVAHVARNQRRPLLDPNTTWTFRLPTGTFLRPAESFADLSSLRS